MTVCYLKQNYRQIRLDAFTTGQHVGVRLRDGSCRFIRWLGFMERCQAQSLGRAGLAVPVRLVLASYQAGDDLTAPRVEVPEGGFIQGCLLSEGVFAVVESGVPRIVYPAAQSVSCRVGADQL